MWNSYTIQYTIISSWKQIILINKICNILNNSSKIKILISSFKKSNPGGDGSGYKIKS